MPRHSNKQDEQGAQNHGRQLRQSNQIRETKCGYR